LIGLLISGGVRPMRFRFRGLPESDIAAVIDNKKVEKDY
jgi:hypothetical protein